MKSFTLTIFITLLFLGLYSCANKKNTPEYIATQYLLALKDKNWEKAKTYTTKENAQNLDMMVSIGGDFGLTDVKDVKCKVYSSNKDQAECTFCCSDSDFYCLDLLKRDNKWMVVMPKDGGCRGPYEEDTLTIDDTL